MTDHLIASKAEDELAAREALQAAWDAMAYMRGEPFENYDDDWAALTKAILSAFAAAGDVLSQAEREFSNKHPGKSCIGPYFNVQHVVATALRFHDEALPPSVSPMSKGGLDILAFVRVCISLEHQRSAKDYLDPEMSFNSFPGDDAKQLISQNFEPAQSPP